MFAQHFRSVLCAKEIHLGVHGPDCENVATELSIMDILPHLQFVLQ